MATFNSRQMILDLIAKNGKMYEDEPGATKIVEYTNAWGGLCWGVVFENERQQDKYDYPTAYIRNPRIMWIKE